MITPEEFLHLINAISQISFIDSILGGLLGGIVGGMIARIPSRHSTHSVEVK